MLNPAKSHGSASNFGGLFNIQVFFNQKTVQKKPLKILSSMSGVFFLINLYKGLSLGVKLQVQNCAVVIRHILQI